MKKIILFFNLILFSFFSNSQIATNPLRGLYVDKFVKYNTISPGVYGPYNTDYSILGVDNDHDGIFEKEVELLKYAQQNHFTTLILYDVSKIFVDPPFMAWNNNAGYQRMVSLQEHLCRFMLEARTYYGITRILAAIGGASEASDVINFNQMFSQPTSSFQYSQSQINSPYFNSRLQSLALQYSLGDPMLLPSEVAKYVLRTISMTGCQCNQSFDGFVTEYEFWTAGSIAANDPLVLSYEILMNDLNQIKLISPLMKIAVYYGHIALSSSNLTCPTCPVEFTDGSSTITQNCMNYCSTYIGEHNSQTIYNGASQPFNFSTEGARRQYIYLGSELAAKGLSTGNISSVAFHLSSAGSALNNLQIRATTSIIPNLSSPYLGSFSASTANSTFTPSTSNLGYDEFTFTSPLNWNGTDNIIIDVSYDNDPNGTQTATGTSSTDYKTQTSGSLNNSVIYIAANNPSGSRTIQTLVPTIISNNRPDFSFRSSFVRRADEIFLEEYYRTTSQYNVATMNSTNEKIFRATNTTDNTVIRPIMSAESKYYGGAPDNFLGEWLFSTPNNSDEQKSIFGAERDHYVSWLSTKQNFSYENQIEPGGCNWFTSSYLLHSFKNTALFYCNSPICTTSALLSVTYIGPREKNIHYLLKITDASSTATQLAIGYTPDFSQNQTNIFSTVNFTLQETNAPYVLELQLDYGNGTPLANYQQQIEVSSNFKIAPIGYVPAANISICDNQQVILKAAKTSNINWFRITDAGMPGDIIQQNGGEYFLASQSGEYYAMRTSGACSNQSSNHIILGGFDQTAFISPVCSTATIEKLTTINFPSTNYNNGNL